MKKAKTWSDDFSEEDIQKGNYVATESLESLRKWAKRVKSARAELGANITSMSHEEALISNGYEVVQENAKPGIGRGRPQKGAMILTTFNGRSAYWVDGKVYQKNAETNSEKG
jgi:hypothetical protein